MPKIVLQHKNTKRFAKISSNGTREMMLFLKDRDQATHFDSNHVDDYIKQHNVKDEVKKIEVKRPKIVEEIITNPVNVDVYHGSGSHFSKFDQKNARIPNDFMGGGIAYFTDHKDVAKTYASSMAKRATKNKESDAHPRLYHTTLKMNNVFDVDHKFSGDKLKNVLPDEKDHESFARGAGLMKLGVDRHKVLANLKDGNVELTGHQVFKGLSRGGIDTAKARDHLISKGYDGLRYNGGVNMDMTTKHNVYIPYHADSITINRRTKLVKKK